MLGITVKISANVGYSKSNVLLSYVPTIFL